MPNSLEVAWIYGIAGSIVGMELVHGIVGSIGDIVATADTSVLQFGEQRLGFGKQSC